MTRRPFAALLISTVCCLSMTLTAFAAVTVGPADTASMDGKNAVVVCGGEDAVQVSEDPTLSGPGVSASPVRTSAVTGERSESLGMFTTTGYCNCPKCNTGGYTLTYSGTVPKARHTISADLDLYPIGTKLMIGDIIYTVEDKGTHVDGNWIDVYYEDHDDAWGHGMKTEEVFAVK